MNEAMPAELEPGLVQMSDDELLSHLTGHENNAIGHYEDQIASEQALGLDYYYGRMPDLPHEEGTSSVVDGTVAVTIDNALAATLKPFVSSDEVVSFSPRGPEDTEQAKQATDYANYVIQSDNQGFLLFHNWFKDALLSKIGVVKCWWEEQERVQSEQFIVADEINLARLRVDPGYAGEQQMPDGSIQVTVEQVVPDGKVRIVNVPPEEFLVNPFARSIEEASYLAHRPSNMTRSDLIEMGFDAEVVESINGPVNKAVSSASNSDRRQARYQDEQSAGTDHQLGTPHDSQRLVDIIDEYVRIDYDGDGIAELRRIVRSSDTILLNEEVDCVPFAAICPVPMPHKLIGRSMADQVAPLQKINTAIWRQTLDNLYKTNNPRPVIGEAAERKDGSTQDSIASAVPGAAILARDPNAMRYESVPFFAQASFTMLDFNRNEAEERSGIKQSGQGIDADALQGGMTATHAALANEGMNARAEMVARIFAETGVKDLFRLVLKLLVKYQPRARMIRLRNEWVEMDPTDWSPEMDLEISVGLGMGSKREKLIAADAILADMAQLVGTPYQALIAQEGVFNALKMKLQAADIKNVDDFYSQPEPEQQQQQEQPDPELIKVQMDQQRKMEDAQFNAELKTFEMQQKLMLEAMKAEGQFDIATYKAEMEADLAAWKARFEALRKVDLSANRPGGSLSE